MSEFTDNSKQRTEKLLGYMLGVVNGENGADLVEKFEILKTQFYAEDILLLFDLLFENNISIEQMKPASNKLFNILFSQISKNFLFDTQENSFVWYMMQDNQKVVELLNKTKQYIVKINKEFSKQTIEIIKQAFRELQKFTIHYTAKENILFPVLEKKWKNNQCLKLMWSFHDDIRRNIKNTIEVLESESFDLKKFNKLCSLVYFNINTIVLREEKILYYLIIKNLDKNILDSMLNELAEMKLHFVDVKYLNKYEKEESKNENLVKLSSGELTIEQIEMIFSNLPVDITFVDENDTVRYFSTPKNRIFPRSNAIIGRKVQNCHPHESVDVVEKIIKSFRKGEKDEASFWFRMGEKYILIKYFAIRNKHSEYKGILEVSQEIQEIQKITGIKKLLDWE